MVRIHDIQQLADIIVENGPQVGSAVFLLLKHLLESRWMDGDEAEELCNLIEEGRTQEAAKRIERHEDSEEISRNLSRLNRELESSDIQSSDDTETLRSKVSIF